GDGGAGGGGRGGGAGGRGGGTSESYSVTGAAAVSPASATVGCPARPGGAHACDFQHAGIRRSADCQNDRLARNNPHRRRRCCSTAKIMYTRTDEAPRAATTRRNRVW